MFINCNISITKSYSNASKVREYKIDIEKIIAQKI